MSYANDSGRHLVPASHPVPVKPPRLAGQPLHRLASVRKQQGYSLRRVARQLSLSIDEIKLLEDERTDLPLSRSRAASLADDARNAMARWYFVPDYQCVRVSSDELAMELVGEGVKLVGEDEVVTHDGARRQAATSNRASQAFVHGFTKAYPELAAKSPVYAQLRNLIDMAIAAAFIQDQDFYGHAEWTMATFGSEQQFPVETNPTPQKVDTVVNSIWRGNRLMTPHGGGVEIRPQEALAADNRLEDEGGKVEKARGEVRIELADGQWWWD